MAGIVELVAPVEHRIFAGKIDKSELGFGERAIMIAVRAPDGDFRDWDEIAAWAERNRRHARDAAGNRLATARRILHVVPPSVLRLIPEGVPGLVDREQRLVTLHRPVDRHIRDRPRP